MEWSLLDWNWNTTVPEVWDTVVEKVNEQSGILGKFLFDKIVLPVGQSLLYHVEVAVQYTLNGEYEVRDPIFIWFVDDRKMLHLKGVPQKNYFYQLDFYIKR